jgi:hypothetical protein
MAFVDTDPELCAELEAQIDDLLRAGFLPADQILEEAKLYVAPTDEPIGLHEHASAYLDDALAMLAVDQKDWPEVTDCDRLDKAFADLESRGIVARQDFSCCQNCGHRDIIEELGPGARGYTFYHSQDTESAIEAGVLWLAVGAVGDAENGALEIAAEVVAALRAQGLTVESDGTGEERITVPLTWQRRLPPE